jgi:catechol-2,3-dioxygenase
MAKPTKLSHYVLQSYDPQALAAWYAEFLGGQVVFQTDFLTLVTYDDEHHRVAFVGLPPAAPGVASRRENGKPGLSHVGFGYESMRDILECFERAKAHGDGPVSSLHHGITISLYYKDLDGNNVETFVDCFQTAQGAMNYMHSPAFQRNPIGQPFDADKALARMREGASISDLMFFDPSVEVDVAKLGQEALQALG